MNSFSVRRLGLPARASADGAGPAPSAGLVPFVALACGWTWLLTLPLLSNRVRGLPPEPYMLACAGLSAFGPTLAAFVVASRQRQLRQVFSRFRTNPWWILVSISIPLCLHLVAKLLELALGGTVTRWLWLPETSAQAAALVAFSLGEEFGWRGFAHARLLDRYGPLLGPLLTGLIWGIWHLFFVITPAGTVELSGFLSMLLNFVLWALVVAWLFERTQRSMAVAIAIHAGGHLDNSARLGAGDARLRMLTLLVLFVAAGFAAYLLWQRSSREQAPRGL